jgi:hypothetical protein
MAARRNRTGDFPPSEAFEGKGCRSIDMPIQNLADFPEQFGRRDRFTDEVEPFFKKAFFRDDIGSIPAGEQNFSDFHRRSLSIPLASLHRDSLSLMDCFFMGVLLL